MYLLTCLTNVFKINELSQSIILKDFGWVRFGLPRSGIKATLLALQEYSVIAICYASSEGVAKSDKKRVRPNLQQNRE